MQLLPGQCSMHGCALPIRFGVRNAASIFISMQDSIVMGLREEMHRLHAFSKHSCMKNSRILHVRNSSALHWDHWAHSADAASESDARMNDRPQDQTTTKAAKDWLMAVHWL